MDLRLNTSLPKFILVQINSYILVFAFLEYAFGIAETGKKKGTVLDLFRINFCELRQFETTTFIKGYSYAGLYALGSLRIRKH